MKMQAKPLLSMLLVLLILLAFLPASASATSTSAETYPFSIEVSSPRQDQTFNSTSLTINLNLTETSICHIYNATIYLDGAQLKKTSVSGHWFWNDYHWLAHRFPVVFQFSHRLENLTLGTHALIIGFEFNETNDWFFTKMQTLNSTEIAFTVELPAYASPSPAATSPSPTPSPNMTASPSVPEFSAWAILALFLISSVICVLIFRKKREFGC